MSRRYDVLELKGTPLCGDHTVPQVKFEQNYASLINERGEKWFVWTPEVKFNDSCTLRDFEATKPRATLIFDKDDFWLDMYNFAINIMKDIFANTTCFPSVPRTNVETFLENATLPQTEDGCQVVVGRNLGRGAAPIPVYDRYGTEHTDTFVINTGDTIRVHLTLLAWCMAPDSYGISLRIGPYGLMAVDCAEACGPYQHVWSPHQYIIDKNKVRHPCGKDFFIDLPEGFLEKILSTKIRVRISDSASWIPTCMSLEKLPSAKPIEKNNCIDIFYKSNAMFREIGSPIQCRVRLKRKLGSITLHLVSIKN